MKIRDVTVSKPVFKPAAAIVAMSEAKLQTSKFKIHENFKFQTPKTWILRNIF
jgi:hypothetical protein